MNVNTDKAIMLCQWKTTGLASSTWINTLNIKEVVWISLYWMLEVMYYLMYYFQIYRCCIKIELPPFEFKLQYLC